MKCICVFALVLTMLFTTGCTEKTYPPPTKYTIENVLRIELLDTSSNEEILLKTITEDELKVFWDSFIQIEFRRYLNDPPTQYGAKAVRIVYSDGWEDIIGTDINGRYKDGKSQAVGWYYLADADAYKNLFANYL